MRIELIYPLPEKGNPVATVYLQRDDLVALLNSLDIPWATRQVFGIKNLGLIVTTELEEAKDDG